MVPGLATTAQRVIAAKLLDMATKGEAAPRSGTSYCEKTIVESAGLPWFVPNFDPGVRSLIAKFASRLPLATHQHNRGRSQSAPRTIKGLVHAELDRMEKLGIPLERKSAGGTAASTMSLADRMGAPRYMICGNPAFVQEIADRVAAGRIKLGGVFVDPRPISRARRRALERSLLAVLERKEAAGEPVLSHPENPAKIWFDPLFDEAGITDPHERDMMMLYEAFRRRLTRTIRSVTLKSEAAVRATARTVTYADLLVEATSEIVRAQYRANPRRKHSDDGESRYLHNERWVLRRFMNGNELTEHDPAPSGLPETVFNDMVAKSYLGSATAVSDFKASMGRWRGIAASLGAPQLPSTFCGALAAAMDSMEGCTVAGTAERVGMDAKLLHDWRNGITPPNYSTEHFVPLLEAVLGRGEDFLRSRLGALQIGRPAGTGKRFLVMEDGRKVRLSKWLRMLPIGAAGWSDDVLRPVLAEVLERHGRPLTISQVRRNASKQNAYGLSEIDLSCPIWAEFDDLAAFKKNLVGGARVQMDGSNWGSDASENKAHAHTADFERWCRLAPELGGLGLHPSQVSFKLLLNRAVPSTFVIWLVTRSAHLLLNGKPIGIAISSSHKHAAGFLSSLLELEYGWLIQSPKEVGPLVPIDVRFRVPRLQGTKTEYTIVDDDSCEWSEVMPASIVAQSEADWKLPFAEARKHARVTASQMAARFTLVQDAQHLVMPILRHKSPIACGLRMVSDALKHARSLETAPVQHARDYMKALMVLMLLTLVFRSETLRNITYKKDNTGDLRFVDDQWELVVDAKKFKNLHNPVLFGPSWRRKDYERELKDWGGLSGILKHFIEVCRPLLLDGRESDLLFPPPDGRDDWDVDNFWNAVSEWTKVWCIKNLRYGTGMAGVKPFGPHAFRSIVAAHILLHWPNEDRWHYASIVLQTGIEQVRLRYGWIDSRREIGETNKVFDDASDLAASAVILY